jgi:hypothetical protein
MSRGNTRRYPAKTLGMIEGCPAITLDVVAIKPLDATIRVALKSQKDIWCRSNLTFPSGPA